MKTATLLDADDLYEQPVQLTTFTPLESVFSRYLQARKSIESIADFVKDNSGVMEYFFSGAMVARNTGSYSASTFFDVGPAIKALDASYWSEVMSMTDVLEAMPAKQRNEWNDQIRKHETVEFDRDTVYATMNDLLLKREHFFMSRVDGLFQSLSGHHVTNQPEGFCKRMIIERVIGWYGSIDDHKCNYIHDLRVVIGKFMGREIPNSRSTYFDIDRIKDAGGFGKWHSFDGGAFKIRLYKKGTLHMEIHPDMTWRLNKILASLHPAAIPAKARSKPVRFKEHVINTDILPFNVISELGRFRHVSESSVSYYNEKLSEQAVNVLTFIGGVKVCGDTWEFNYPVINVLHEVIRSGELPEKKSHQFFETPEALAERVVDMASIEDGHSILEPSAGRGALCAFMPKENLTCIDVSHLYYHILKEKGYCSIHADFLQWKADLFFDRIVLNPPYSNNRALDHLTKAFQHLKPDGRLIAILPASMKGNIYFDGWTHEWSEVLENEFKESGTGVNVVILTLYR